jgi:hypothetical protein
MDLVVGRQLPKKIECRLIASIVHDDYPIWLVCLALNTVDHAGKR